MCADRGHEMGRLTYKRHPVRSKAPCGLDRQGKSTAAGLKLYLTEDGMGAPLDLVGHRSIGQIRKNGCFGRIHDENQA